MTPQQEARLLRARAATLRAQASYLWVREPALDAVCCAEADACEAIAAELDPLTPAREPRDAEDSCLQFVRGDTTKPGYCSGDGHYRCRECAEFDRVKP